jgi:hypothetical protein
MPGLEDLQGKLIKLVWRDGDETKVKKGRLVSIGDFLELRTHQNTYRIRADVVISIKSSNGGER